MARGMLLVLRGRFVVVSVALGSSLSLCIDIMFYPFAIIFDDDGVLFATHYERLTLGSRCVLGVGLTLFA